MVTHTSLANSFYVIPGWAEGNWQSKKLVNAMETAGYVRTSCKDAHILIAHSGGCYLLPDEHDGKIIILIGIPYWPHKSIIRALYQKVRQDALLNNLPYTLTKSFWNIVYILTKPLMTLRMWQAAHKPNPLSVIPAEALIIRNQEDTFCTPDISHYLKREVISLAGQHDDCWINPSPYVGLIKAAYA